MRNLLHFAILTTPGSDAKVAGRVTAACRRCHKNHTQHHLKNLVDIDAIGRYRPPSIQTSGDAYSRADYMPIQDNHRAREDILCG